jgi:molecular chaperone GrpE
MRIKKEKHPEQEADAKTPAQDNPSPGTDVAVPTKGKPEIEMVTLTKDEHATLQQDLEETRQKAAGFFDGWQRERADFSNYKKRLERDQEQRNQNFTGNFIKRYLVVLDDLERALKTRPVQGEGAAWSEGVELICRKLQNILEMEGVKPIPNDRKTFDPTLHEAITHEDSPEHASGDIIEVVQQGYMIGDRVLRPALVRVAR